MKPLSYRSRLAIKRALLIALGVLCAAALVVVGVVVYLERYAVYTNDGVYFPFLHQQEPGSASQPGPQDETLSFPAVEIGPEGVAQRPGTDQPGSPADTQPAGSVRGVSLSYADLQDPQGCLDAIHAQEDCNTVLLQLKSSAGNFYYQSQLPGAASSLDNPGAVNELMQTLHREGYRLIARVTAFADSAYALDHIPESLQLANGALWMDSDGYYWLNAADEDVVQYLTNLSLELAGLGVNEIAFAGFAFPDSGSIQYGELDAAARAGALSAAASTLINLGAQNQFAVSFCDPADGSPAPSADGHVILSGYEGAAVADAAAQYQSLTSGPASLIFLTDSRDTRFEPYGILRSCERE